MTWKSGANSALGRPAVCLTAATIDATAQVAIGTVMTMYDDTQGQAEFIYLPGLAATAVGDLVVYDLCPAAQAIVRSLAATHANTGRPVAVAVAPVTAGLFGWFQISGVAIVNVTAGFTAGAKVFANATAGQGTQTTTAGCQIIGATGSSATGTPAAGQAYVTLQRPSFQTQIT